MNQFARHSGFLALAFAVVTSCGDDESKPPSDAGDAGRAGEAGSSGTGEAGTPSAGGAGGETTEGGAPGAGRGGEPAQGGEGGQPGPGGEGGDAGGGVAQGGASVADAAGEGALGGEAGTGVPGGASGDAGQGGQGGSPMEAGAAGQGGAPGQGGAAGEGGAGGEGGSQVEAGSGGEGGEAGQGSVNTCPALMPIGTFDIGLNFAIGDNLYDGTLDTMLCLDVNVSCTGTVFEMSLVTRVNHTYVGDLTIKLVSPSATVVTLLNRAGSNVADDGTNNPGGNNSNLETGSPIGFDDDATVDAELMGDALMTGGVVCADDGECVFRPNPDTATGGTLASLDGEEVQGTWQLCFGDGNVGDQGSVRSVALYLGP